MAKDSGGHGSDKRADVEGLIREHQKKYKYVGLRTTERPERGASASRVWKDGEPTNRKLSGLSTTDAKHPHAFAMHGLAPKNWRVGYYPGGHTVVYGSNEARKGRDAGELILKNPTRIKEFKK